MTETIPNPDNLPAISTPVGPSIMSDEEVDQAASEAGLTRVKGRSIRGLKRLGQHLDASGLVHVKLGTLLETDERLSELDEKLNGVFDSFPDGESKLAALRLQKEICDSKIKSAELAVKMADAKLVSQGNQGPGKAPAFPAGANVSIHLHGDKEVKVDGEAV